MVEDMHDVEPTPAQSPYSGRKIDRSPSRSEETARHAFPQKLHVLRHPTGFSDGRKGEARPAYGVALPAGDAPDWQRM
jgi:hypothetical protein